MNEAEVMQEKLQESPFIEEEKSLVSVATIPIQEEQNPKKEFAIQERIISKEFFSEDFIAFKKLFDDEIVTEKKLQLAIDCMANSLAQGKTPHFRSFWEARALCLPLFKDTVPSIQRLSLWNKYTDLSKEARRLKELLDEQSAFAVEQIEMAIVALEQHIQTPSYSLEKENFFSSEAFPQVLKKDFELYLQLQVELHLLNTHATRINELRKELLKTDMRVRNKNKFFQRLSAAGDQVFPKRKELIKQVSQQFSDDVGRFITTYFAEGYVKESFYVLREEIKRLQGLAKFLTLNTHSFTETRARLSECWDQIKAEEKERKKERTRRKVEENSKTKQEERQHKESDNHRLHREKFISLKKEAEILIQSHENIEEEDLAKQREILFEQAIVQGFGKAEKQELERILKPLRDIIADKRDKKLLSLSEDDRQALQQLKNMVCQKKERRQEIKTQLEELRKAAGSSSLDFEKAIACNHRINEEKECLEKVNQVIREMEKNIITLQEKIREKKS